MRFLSLVRGAIVAYFEVRMGANIKVTFVAAAKDRPACQPECTRGQIGHGERQ